MIKSNCLRGLMAGLLAMTLSLAAVAGESGEDAWQFDGAVYLWGAGIGGTTTAGDDIDVSFSDLLRNLDLAFMGTLDAHKGKWSLIADVIYFDVSGSDRTTANLINRPVSADVDVAMSRHGSLRRVLGMR